MRRSRKFEDRIPKFDCRNPKQSQMTEFPKLKTPCALAISFGHLNFGFWYCFEFRDSDFGFQIRPVLRPDVRLDAQT
jgi:hypothetical protein